MPHSIQPIPVATLFANQKSQVETRRLSFGLAERKAVLRRLAETIRQNEADIVAALAQDFAKPEAEVRLTEILPVQQEIRHTLSQLRQWMRPQKVAPTLATLGTTAQVVPQARGVCLIMSPWNYPFNLALGPLVSCLAAGNSAILKPSELTPATSALISRLVAATFTPDLVAVVGGDKQVAQALLALPFDHIFFTGSPAVGQVVMAAAAKHLTSVTLELGGKSPTIVGPGADLEQAARWVAFGKFTNAGQTCIAPDHVFVHQSVKDAFLKALRQRLAAAYGPGQESLPPGRSEPGPAGGEHMAHIVSDSHAARLAHLVRDALAKGAQVVHDGGRQGRAMGPTVLEAITPEMALENEEIFGPVLPILPYEHLNDVLARINARPKPLALYVFDRDHQRVQHIVQATSSGGVGINLTVLHYTHHGLPFGGVNTSGMGAAHGVHGFRAFSHQRAVLRNRFSALPLLFAPYTAGVKRLIALVQRTLG